MWITPGKNRTCKDSYEMVAGAEAGLGHGKTWLERIPMKRCKPAVPRHWLLLAAAGLWFLVGLGLCITASLWLSASSSPAGLFFGLGGIGLGCLAYRFLFSKIARRNKQRILAKPERLCFFAFQAWRSYLLIAVMISLGHLLRHSHVPRHILVVVYLAVGTALALGSSIYYD